MLSLGIGTRVVLATEPVDLRRGHDGLISLVRSRWDADPYSGTVFVFLGRRADRVKILFFARGGFVVYYKRLERGRFKMPLVADDASSITLDGAALAMLLDGIDLGAVKRPELWSPRKTTASTPQRIDIRSAS